MDDSRQEQIEQLYRAALARPEQERESFLTETCAGNPGLRRDLDARLLATGAATETLVGPSGFVGPYEILGPLGAGGMGEVFRGRDPRLGRPVAIKFLTRATVANHAALERFRREAQAISALNHPNVCTIYDIGDQDGRPYLVMELLEGQTLKQRIASGPFSNPQLLATSIPIVEGMEAAHASGIVHRDIKPANIFITKLGIVKILDFGLAKTSGPGSDPAHDSLTVPGTTVGTAAYMSPEQVRGEPVDARSDLFAVGAVMYEMATGKRPFEGAGWVATINAVMNHPAKPARELNPELLPDIEHAIEKTLQKDPAARFQTAAALRTELVRIKGNQSATSAPIPIPPPPRKSSLPYVLTIAALVLAIAGAAWYFLAPHGPVTSPSEYVQLTKFADTATGPALSPDGKMVAFFRGGGYFLDDNAQLYVKLLPDGESRQLTQGADQKYAPVFTPDGSRITYTSHALNKRSWATWTVPVLGGTPTLLLPNAAGLSWLDPNRILFSEVMEGTPVHMGVMTSLENRLEERTIYFPNHERAMAHYSWPSPDRSSILIVEMDRTAEWQRCRVLPMQGGSVGVQVGPDGACILAAWSPDGKWMYLNVEQNHATHLWRQRVPGGMPEQITFGPSEEEGVAVMPDGKSLITSIGSRQSSVWIHDASGDHAVSVEGFASQPALSPNGKRLYFLLRPGNSGNATELWTEDVATGKAEALLKGQPIESYSISTDQTHAAYSVRNGTTSQVYYAPLDRSSSPHQIAPSGDMVQSTPDGDVLFRQLGDRANSLVRLHPDGSGKQTVLDPVLELLGTSPDGEWISLSTYSGKDATFAAGTFVVSLKDPAVRRRICTGPCRTTWSADGKSLYVASARALTSTGRTLVIPLPNGIKAAPLPEAGFDRDDKYPGLRVIQENNVYPGPDPGIYSFVKASFQGNLFRIPLH